MSQFRVAGVVAPGCYTAESAGASGAAAPVRSQRHREFRFRDFARAPTSADARKNSGDTREELQKYAKSEEESRVTVRETRRSEIARANLAGKCAFARTREGRSGTRG